MPIRFSPMNTTFRMLPISQIQTGICGCLVVASEAEQAAGTLLEKSHVER
jgi:hypothetical protein